MTICINNTKNIQTLKSESLQEKKIYVYYEKNILEFTYLYHSNKTGSLKREPSWETIEIR